MYKIIGGDGKVYGPVTEDHVRQWIAEGRANGQTQVLAEGEQQWKPLSMIPAFATSFGAAQPGSVTGPAFVRTPEGREQALRAVHGPVIGLKVTAILGLVVVGLGLISNLLVLLGVYKPASIASPEFQRLFNSLNGGFGIIQGLVQAAIAIVILKGAEKMDALQGYSMAMTAGILALVPCVSPCCLVGLPLGIWAIVVLNRPEVKSQFE